MRALVVDDEELIRDVARAVLTAAGWEVDVAADAGRAMLAASRARFDVALVDVHLVGGGGLALCRALRALRDPPHILLSSGDAGDAVVLAATAAGACGFLAKPFRPRELLAAMERTLEGL